MPSKIYQALVFSSSDLVYGSEYSLYSGGRSTGTETDELYFRGTYATSGSATEFILNSVVKSVTK